MKTEIKEFLPDGVRRPLGQMRRQFRDIEQRVNNSVRAFRDREPFYRLAIGTFEGFEVAYREGTADERVLAASFSNDHLLDCLAPWTPAPEDTIIDVGAHIGTFALWMASKAPQGRIFAVEASQETFNYLRINKQLNDVDNLQVDHLALADRPGTLQLYHAPSGNWGHTITKAHDEGRCEEVEARRLDDYLEGHGIERCALLKLNCEGAEFPILLSTPPEALARMERILVLYHLDLVEGYDLPQLRDHLHQAGFETVIDASWRDGIRGRLIARKA